MALSGSFKTNGYYSDSKGDNIYLEFAWTATQSIASNTSTIAWTLKGSRTASGYVNAGAFKVVIDGETVYSKGTDYRIELRNGTLVASGSKTITHNSEGARTFAVSIQGAIYYYSVNCTGNQTFTLDTIPRKSTLSVTSGELAKPQTLTVARKTSSFTHTITWSCGSYADTICTKDNRTTIPWTPSIELATQNTTGSSVAVTFTISTYSGNTLIGSNTATATYTIPSSVTPVLAHTVSDISDLSDDFRDDERYIQGYTKLFVDISTCYGSYGAWIKSIKTTIEGATYTTNPVTSNTLKTSGNQTVTVVATDSRGRTTTATTDLYVYPYERPKILRMSAFRSNADGDQDAGGAYMTVNYTYRFFYIAEVNEIDAKLSIKKTSDTSYEEIDVNEYGKWTPDYTGWDLGYYDATWVVTFPADVSSYDVLVEVTDGVSGKNGAKTSAVVPPVKQTFSLLKKAGDIVGMAWGKLAELEDVFDIALQTRFSGGLLHSVLPTNSDVNSLLTPTTYMLLSANTYSNMPEGVISGFLEIVGIKEGSLIQRLSIFDKTNPREYERIHYSTTGWGDWVCVRGDFVVEQGEKNGWTYRKWNSGVGECWKTLSYTTTVTGAWGSMYISGNIERQNYPFAFTTKPAENVGVVAGGDSGWICPQSATNGGTNGAYASAVYNIVRPTALSSYNTYYVNYQVKGKWK